MIKYLCGSYEVGFEVPEIRYLQPFTGNSNPFFLGFRYRVFKPTINQAGSKRFGMYNPVSFINF
jgi:hypothetical protein